MASAEQSGEPHRDYSSPATWGDVERVRLSLEAHIAKMETRLETKIAETRAEVATVGTQVAQTELRLTRMFLGSIAAGVAVLGVLMGILQAVD